VPRKYNAPRRVEQADATRLAIIDAAAALFAENGYGATTMTAIAAQARVSQKSVYALGDKAQLLQLALDRVLLGDENVGRSGERPPVTAVLDGEATADDPVEALRQGAAVGAAMIIRMYPLYRAFEQAAAVDEEILPVWRDFQERRREDVRRMLESFQRRGLLRAGLELETAVDTVWALFGWHPVALLMEERKWDAERVTAWMDEVVRALLMGPAEQR